MLFSVSKIKKADKKGLLPTSADPDIGFNNYHTSIYSKSRSTFDKTTSSTANMALRLFIFDENGNKLDISQDSFTYQCAPGQRWPSHSDQGADNLLIVQSMEFVVFYAQEKLKNATNSLQGVELGQAGSLFDSVYKNTNISFDKM